MCWTTTFFALTAANGFCRNKVRHCPIRDVLRDWLLLDYDHLIEWVKVKPIHKDEFVGKGKVKPQLDPRFCKFLVDGNELGVEELTNPTDIITL